MGLSFEGVLGMENKILLLLLVCGSYSVVEAAEAKNITFGCLSVDEMGQAECDAFVEGLGGSTVWNASFFIQLESSSTRCVSIRRETQEEGQRIFKVIGVVFYVLPSSVIPTVDIEYLVVIPEYQGCGIGSDMLDYLRNRHRCKKMLIRPLKVERDFYRKRGFAPSEDDEDQWEKNISER